MSAALRSTQMKHQEIITKSQPTKLHKSRTLLSNVHTWIMHYGAEQEIRQGYR